MTLLRAIALAILVAVGTFADSRHQTFSDFTIPMPLQRGQALIIGIVGGWERWDNPARCIRRTAIGLKRMKMPGVFIETVENHKLDLAEQLVRRAFDFNNDGTLAPDEARDARVILFGQSLGGRATLWFARTLHEMNVPVRFAFVIDAYGKDSYVVPPNVRAAANIYQRDHWLIKGADEITAQDPSRTTILYNRRVTYKGREHAIDTSDDTKLHRTFMGAHTLIEHDMELWNQVMRAIAEAARARD